jgi:hypothetical protein
MDNELKLYFENIIKHISIRGRMYYCSFCLRNAFEKDGIINEETNLILNIINDFIQTNDFNKWKECAENILPVNILDKKFTISDFSIEHEVIYKLKSFYENVKNHIIDLIDYTLGVGLDNLYGGTGEYSFITLKNTLNVIIICKRNNIEIPEINNFIKYSFNEMGGWGDIIKNNGVRANGI